MNNLFYPKLALSNIKKNKKSYVPYLLTCVITAMMFYIIYVLATNKGVNSMPGVETVQYILSMAVVIVAIFSMIFLFYTNSFLIKQRKKEIGLYNVLGMGKRHIAKMLVWESVFIMFVTLCFGLIGGVVFSKFMFLILLKLLKFKVDFAFTVSPTGILYTCLLFGGIFLVNLLFNLFQIRIANAVELLHGGNQGEKEPKTRWFYGLFGVVTLGLGYGIAIVTDSPLTALVLFFVAVILVILGTYALFIAGSVIWLKLLRKRKNYYYKANHFISVSSMIYRMKQNAAGLANICILSTFVLVMLSTTISLYAGMEDLVLGRYPYEHMIRVMEYEPEQKKEFAQIVENAASKSNAKIKEEVQYESYAVGAAIDGNTFDTGGAVKSTSEIIGLTFLTLEDFNRIEKSSEQLKDGEILIFSNQKEKLGLEEINLGSYTLRIVKELTSFTLIEKGETSMFSEIYIVVPDHAFVEEIATNVPNAGMNSGITYNHYLDLEGSDKEKAACVAAIDEAYKESGASFYSENREEQKDGFYSLYGGFLFIGIFLGALFLMATVLIIYYKQISEGMDDRQRFQIMQKVGMSQKEVKQSIRSQVLTVFFLPLGVAVLHILVAFRVITLLLKALYLTNVALFRNCTIFTVVIFTIFYGIVYLVTAKEYYKIVKA